MQRGVVKQEVAKGRLFLVVKADGLELELHFPEDEFPDWALEVGEAECYVMDRIMERGTREIEEIVFIPVAAAHDKDLAFAIVKAKLRKQYHEQLNSHWFKDDPFWSRSNGGVTCRVGVALYV